MKQFISRISEDGITWVIEKLNAVTSQYEVIEEGYPSMESAVERTRLLNAEYAEDERQLNN
jgi:hypothetical protein